MPIGKFEVLGQLGSGAGSTVLKIRRESDRQIYALKVVKIQSPEDKRYFDQVEHEYLIGARLDHPHLCKVIAFEVEKSLLKKITGAKLLLEFVDGKPLSKLRDMSVGKLLVVFAKTAAAIAQMHASGYIHADIKPDNILVTPDGDVKVIDFGVAWRKGEQKGRVQGTLDYLAPEQGRQKIANEQTDIFNLGATMYDMFTGATVPATIHVKGSSGFGRIDDLIRPLTDLNPKLTPGIDELVRKCLRFHPSDRPSSMKEVFKSLKKLVEERQAEKKRKREGETK